jgi:hypothetical protein
MPSCFGDATAENQTALIALMQSVVNAIDSLNNGWAQASTVNRSGKINSSNQAQTFAQAKADRRGFMIRNKSTLSSLYINELGEAAQNKDSCEIKPGEIYVTPLNGCPVTEISIIGPTTNQEYYGREW